MKKSFTDINELIKFLKLDKKNQEKILKNSFFPLLLPFHLAKKIKKNDLTDPIFKQFVPLIDEEKIKKSFNENPLKENIFQKANLLKKYNKRALLLVSNSCSMHCRYCFRKFFENKKNDFEKEINLIKKDKTLEEIILSGGDPLSLSNANLENLLKKLDNIKHIKRIRFHTRYIIGFPSRINNELLNILKNIKKQIVFIFHVNHPKELDKEVIKAVEKLKNLNFPLFNQTVLLKGINDKFLILKKLNDKLFSIGITPYYLHQLDKIKGASHFEVPIDQGKKIIKNLKENASGYLVPKYVQEKAYEKNKVQIL